MVKTPVTRALTMNGRIHGELKDPEDAPEVVLRKRLELLDGVDRYSLSLWRLPPGVRFDRVDLTRWPQEYVQVAGSRDRLTAELRRIEGSGPCQYVIGRAAADPGQPTTKLSLPWNGHEAMVFANEVLNSAEAAAVFLAYMLGNDLKDGFALRRLED